jgi:micrococcal nuclease
MLQKSLRSVSQRLIPHGRSWLRSLLAVPLLVAASPAWGLNPVARPDLAKLKRAEVIGVVDSSTLVVQIEGDLQARLVHLIGVDPLPGGINPTWTELRRQTPLPIYAAGQYLKRLCWGARCS